MAKKLEFGSFGEDYSPYDERDDKGFMKFKEYDEVERKPSQLIDNTSRLRLEPKANYLSDDIKLTERYIERIETKYFDDDAIDNVEKTIRTVIANSEKIINDLNMLMTKHDNNAIDMVREIIPQIIAKSEKMILNLKKLYLNHLRKTYIIQDMFFTQTDKMMSNSIHELMTKENLFDFIHKINKLYFLDNDPDLIEKREIDLD